MQSACKGKIMQQSTDNGEQTMGQFLGMLNFEHVKVIPASVPTCEAPATSE